MITAHTAKLYNPRFHQKLEDRVYSAFHSLNAVFTRIKPRTRVTLFALRQNVAQPFASE
jgi:hypothetical protein